MEVIREKSKVIVGYFLFCVFLWLIIAISSFGGEIPWGFFGRTIILPLFFVSLYCMKMVGISFFELPSLIFILCFLLHFGQLMIKSVITDYKFEYDVLLVLSPSGYFQTVLFSILFIQFYSIGMMISYTKKEKKMPSRERRYVRKSNYLKRFGWIAFWLFMPLELFVTSRKIIAGLTGGYLNVFQVSLNGFLDLFAKFHVLALAALILAYRRKKRFVLCLYSSYVIYSLVSMLSGSRMYQLYALLLLGSLTKVSTGLKIKFRHFVLLLFGGVGTILFLNALSSIRDVGIERMGLLKALEQSWEKNPMLDFLEELGSTLVTPGLVLERIQNHDLYHTGGLQDLVSFLGILPNLGGGIKEIVDKTYYVLLLEKEYIGGSIIGEFYYNWGWGLFPFSCMLGYGIGFVSRKIKFFLTEMREFSILYFIMPMYGILQWQRGAFPDCSRYLVYSSLFLLLYQSLVRREHFYICASKGIRQGE